MNSEFTGFTRHTFDFLFEVGLINTCEWFEQNRKRYETHVKRPLYALAARLLPTVLEADPAVNRRIASCVSRIRRDTRYTEDKRPYRSNAWIAYRHPQKSVSESWSFYFEISPEGYGYGMGMFSGDAARMNAIRKAIKAEPSHFLALAAELEANGFSVYGDSYKRNRYPDADEAVARFLNLKGLGWSFFSDALTETMTESFADVLENRIRLMTPMYRFIQNALLIAEDI